MPNEELPQDMLDKIIEVYGEVYPSLSSIPITNLRP
jgi:hypothetical protein